LIKPEGFEERHQKVSSNISELLEEESPLIMRKDNNTGIKATKQRKDINYIAAFLPSQMG